MPLCQISHLLKNWLAVFVYFVGMVQMAANVNNSTHLISVLNVTTGISAVLTALSLVGVIVTVTLIFAISLPVLWTVLIGCACATVIGLIVFLSVRYASSECEVPTEENYQEIFSTKPITGESQMNDTITIGNAKSPAKESFLKSNKIIKKDLGPPFDENEFKYNPNIGDPLEEIPDESVKAAISDPASPYFPVMVGNCIRILSQMNDTITIGNAVRFLARKYAILPSLSDMLVASYMLPRNLTTSHSLKELKEHFDDGKCMETEIILIDPNNSLSFFAAIGTLFQNHAIAISAKDRNNLSDGISSHCLDDTICFRRKPTILTGNCSGSQVTPENFYQMTRRNEIPDSNVLCVHYDNNGHIQIDKPPERNE
jgi:hypothetical protein